MSYKGWFTPQNPNKYKGNADRIVYRSSWELRVMKNFDENPSVIWWASEEMFVKYVSPIDKRVHRYFTVFVVRVKKKDGKEATMMLEVKPEKQTKPPKQSRRTRKMLAEVATYAINQEKWKAAELFCLEHGWQFKILTEKELGI
jgi:hypothetical protein